MNEGDPKVVDWQEYRDCDTSTAKFPDVPQGMEAGGPWYAFAAYGFWTDDGSRHFIVYRRPLVRAEEWTTLASLPPGTLFETKNGERGLKLAVAATEPECVRVAWLAGGQMSTQTGGFLVRRIPPP